MAGSKSKSLSKRSNAYTMRRTCATTTIGNPTFSRSVGIEPRERNLGEARQAAHIFLGLFGVSFRGHTVSTHSWATDTTDRLVIGGSNDVQNQVQLMDVLEKERDMIQNSATHSLKHSQSRPANSTLLPSISAKMHPTDQTSTIAESIVIRASTLSHAWTHSLWCSFETTA